MKGLNEMKLLIFELKKMIFDKKFLYLSLILIAGVSLLFFRNLLFESYIEREEQQKIDSYILTSQSHKTGYEVVLESKPDDEAMQLLYALNNEMLDRLLQIRNLISSEDWQSKLLLENEFLQYTKEFKDNDGSFPIPNEEIEETIAMNSKLLEENIRPEHPTYTTALPNFLKIITGLFVNLGAIIIIFLFVGDILSTEFENRSIQFLYTQPLNKLSIVSSKWISSVLAYLFIVVMIYGTTIGLCLAFGDAGTFNYPVLIELNYQLEFITTREYIQQSAIIVSVTVLLVISLNILYSLLFKHTLASMFATVGTLLIGYLLTFIPWRFLFWFNPFQYVIGDARIYNQNITDWYQGVAVGLFISIIIFTVSLLRIKYSKIES